MEILINRLDEVQAQIGWLPEHEIERIAKEYDIPKAHLYGIISFYSRFYTAPVGKYIIRVCKSVSCGMNGSRDIRSAVLEVLKTETGDSDLFTLELVECLGHCHLAPVMTVNDVVHGNLTKQSVKTILEAYRNGTMIDGVVTI